MIFIFYIRNPLSGAEGRQGRSLKTDYFRKSPWAEYAGQFEFFVQDSTSASSKNNDTVV